MTVYWVNVFTRIDDERRLAAYAALAGPAMEAAGGRFLARGEPLATLEGAPAPRATIIEFPDRETAVAAYESEGYQAALAALGDSARRDIRVLPGV